MSKPSVYRRFFKKTLILGGPIVLIALAGWSLRFEQSFFIVKEVPVSLEYHKSQKAMLVGLKPTIEKQFSVLRGSNIWRVSLSDFRRTLLNHPWIDDVVLRRSFPNKISALIRLHQPVLLFADKRNRLHPILKNGLSVEPLNISTTPEAPILRNNKIFSDSKKLSKLLDLFQAIPSFGPLKAENIASVDYDAVTGLSVELIKQKATVHFGHQDIQTKGLQIIRVIDYLESQKQKARVIDGSFAKKVLVRPRKGS